jgi:hypothetical protein
VYVPRACMYVHVTCVYVKCVGLLSRLSQCSPVSQLFVGRIIIIEYITK